MSESLSDKLKSLGVQMGTQHLSAPAARKKRSRIESVIAGETFPTAYGDAFIVQQDYPTDHCQGEMPLCKPEIDLAVLCQWAAAPDVARGGVEKLVFLDTETSGLAGGTGTYAFLVGLGYQTAGGFRLVQLLMRDPSEEPAMLAALQEILAPFEAVVTFNGKSFDVPLLNTRHVLNGIDSPFHALAHLDLLPLARRLWRNRLANRALSNLEVEILGMARTDDEVPGWMIPEIYFEYLRSGDANPLKGVLYHNGMDILSLAALLNHTAGLLAAPLQNTTPNNLDLIAIARLYEDLGRIETAVELYEYSLHNDLPEPFLLDTLNRFALLYRRRGQWQEAVRLWQMAAEYHNLPACVELAKFYEHQARDQRSALHWTDFALAQLPHQNGGLILRQEWQRELNHRRERLLKQIARREE